VLQADNIYNLHDKESLVNLIKNNIYWLDMTGPSRSDLKTISEVQKIQLIPMYSNSHYLDI
jgi:hypothetical protein